MTAPAAEPAPAAVPAAPPRAWHAELAWLPGRGVCSDVLIEAAGDRFTAVTPGVRASEISDGLRPGMTRLPGLTLPGLANAHSHAFHRALRGITQVGLGTFWTWRERMYEVAAGLDPDSYLALARAVYAEMALAGITCVGEFHYLHHGPEGVPYADPNEMGRAVIAAAAQAGIRITLLDTCYLSGGLSPDGRPQPLTGTQLRFGDGDGEAWAARAEALGADEHGLLGPLARAGAAIHSVRAVPLDQMHPVIAWAHRYGAPLHAHLSEQRAENEASLAAYRRTPAEVLYDAGALGPRATVVHATHLVGRRRRPARRQPDLRLLLPDDRGRPGRRDRPGPRAGHRGLPADPRQRQPGRDRPVRGGAPGRARGAPGQRAARALPGRRAGPGGHHGRPRQPGLARRRARSPRARSPTWSRSRWTRPGWPGRRGRPRWRR